MNGVNYSLQLRGEYRLQVNWYISGSIDANNANDYKQASAGLTIKYLFNNPATVTGESALSVPDWKGFQPFGSLN